MQRGSGKVDTIGVKIPAGIEDGKKIRLRGQGEPSPTGGREGDLLIDPRRAHPFFRRRGDDLDVRVPVTLFEAAEGAKVEVPTPAGTVSAAFRRALEWNTLRIKGHGVAKSGKTPGDLYAEVLIMLPKQIDSAISSRFAPYARRSDRSSGRPAMVT